MSTSIDERVTRGLPTNVEEAANYRWYANYGGLPQLLHRAEWQLYNHQERLFRTEKEAINDARKHALAEEARWQENINALDKRYDAIEDEEMAQEKRRINDPD